MDRLYPALNNSKQQTLFPTNQNNFGEVLVSIYYNNRIQTLEIKVREARNLVPVESRSSMMFNQFIKSSSQNSASEGLGQQCASSSKSPIQCNPYVKTYLLPDKSSSSKRKTRPKLSTFNPIFNDLLSYIVESKDVRSRTLWLTVWHWDKFARNQVKYLISNHLNGQNFESFKILDHRS